MCSDRLACYRITQTPRPSIVFDRLVLYSHEKEPAPSFVFGPLGCVIQSHERLRTELDRLALL
jgi:hypothetical protein